MFCGSLSVGGAVFFHLGSWAYASKRKWPLSKILKTKWDLICGSNSKEFQDRWNNMNKTVLWKRGGFSW